MESFFNENKMFTWNRVVGYDDRLELKIIYGYIDIHAPSATYIYATNYDGKQKIFVGEKKVALSKQKSLECYTLSLRSCIITGVHLHVHCNREVYKNSQKVNFSCLHS